MCVRVDVGCCCEFNGVARTDVKLRGLNGVAFSGFI